MRRPERKAHIGWRIGGGCRVHLMALPGIQSSKRRCAATVCVRLRIAYNPDEMAKLTPDREKQVCEVLLKLDWMETEHALHSEGVRAVRDVLQCSTEDAKAILGDLRARKLIALEVTPGGQLDAGKPMPVAQFRWIRLATGY